MVDTRFLTGLCKHTRNVVNRPFTRHGALFELVEEKEDTSAAQNCSPAGCISVILSRLELALQTRYALFITELMVTGFHSAVPAKGDPRHYLIIINRSFSKKSETL